MSGVKGRSGRRTMADEVKRFKVIDRAWDLVSKALEDETGRFNLKDKVAIAEKIVGKDIAREVSIEGDGLGKDRTLILQFGQLHPKSEIFERNASGTAESSPSV